MFWIAVSVGVAVAWLFPTWIAVLSRSDRWGIVFVINLASVVVWLAWPFALGMAIAETNEQSRGRRMPAPAARRRPAPDEDWREALFREPGSGCVAPAAGFSPDRPRSRRPRCRPGRGR